MRLFPSPQIRTKRGPGVVVCRVMCTFDQGFSLGLASVGIVMTYFLHTMIIWYIKKKPLGTTTPFDMVTIDTILIRLAIMSLFFILFLTSIIEGNTIPNSSWTFVFHQPVFKKMTLAGLYSLQQKRC